MTLVKSLHSRIEQEKAKVEINEKEVEREEGKKGIQQVCMKCHFMAGTLRKRHFALEIYCINTLKLMPDIHTHAYSHCTFCSLLQNRLKQQYSINYMHTGLV